MQLIDIANNEEVRINTGNVHTM